MLNGPVVNGVTLVLVVVAAMPTCHLSMRSMPLLPYCLMQRLPMDRSCIDWIVYHNCVAVAVWQFDGLAPTSHRFIGNCMFHLGVWCQSKTPSALILSGPVEIGVTSVLPVAFIHLRYRLLTRSQQWLVY
jgi:hypothetical protein